MKKLELEAAMASTLLINSCTFILLLLTSFVSPLSFNLSTIGPDNANRDIMLQGDAYISTKGLQVTTDESADLSYRGTGRATYVHPLLLWDNVTANVTDFDTHFSFVIQTDSATPADGLAFFLAPFNSTLPSDSGGGGLGLSHVNYSGPVNSTLPFVAVEFDTFFNSQCDPAYIGGPHVGIDVGSIISVTSAPWGENFTEGGLTDVWITYKSSSKKLLVNFTAFVNNETQTSSLNYTIDMRKYLPEMVSVGFSAATGFYFQKNNVKSWSFSSTLELKIPDVTAPLDPSSNSSSKIPDVTAPLDPSSSSSSRPKTKASKVIGLVAGLCIAVLGLVALGYYWLWSRKIGETNEEEEDVWSTEMDFEKGSGPRRFSYGELAMATNNFAEELKLGEGGFGGVYRGLLKKEESEVAVKRVSKSSKQGAKEYASEVKIISKLRHRNLVQLIGWCHEKRELLLVYELQPNGSLDSHLFKNKSSLTWETRFKIARGLASALLYLHQEWEQCVVHRDIKSSNVMLDSGFNAKLGDFGLARLVDHDKDPHTTILAGTMGYMAPECVMTGKASKESDVYSLGIVALEIATGRRAIQGGVRTVEWVWELYGRGLHLEAADPDLMGYEEREMERLMVVGLWCAHPDDTLRPSIKDVVRFLAFEAQPPPLPSKMPLPTYSAPLPTTSVSSLFSATSSSTYSYATSSSASASSPSPLLPST